MTQLIARHCRELLRDRFRVETLRGCAIVSPYANPHDMVYLMDGHSHRHSAHLRSVGASTIIDQKEYVWGAEFRTDAEGPPSHEGVRVFAQDEDFGKLIRDAYLRVVAIAVGRYVTAEGIDETSFAVPAYDLVSNLEESFNLQRDPGYDRMTAPFSNFRPFL